MIPMTDKARVLKRKIGDSNLGPMVLNQAQNEDFWYFLEFGLYLFLEIAYNDSLRQCLKSSRDKTHEENLGGPNLGQIGQNQTQN